MKLYLASDLHLEFGDLEIYNEDNVDCLILAGDILVATDLKHTQPNKEGGFDRAERYRKFFRNINQEFPNVVYVMGNHEHYGGDFAKSAQRIRDMIAEYNLHNVHLLDKEAIDIDGYTIIGGTLWTDFNRGDGLVMYTARERMNDYHGVKNSASGHAVGDWRFKPAHTLHDHNQMMSFIRVVLGNRHEQGITDNKVVVVGHHAPSRGSIASWVSTADMLSSCFVSDLDEFITDHPDIQLWVHGHTHDDFDYTVGDTRIVCNPRGYWGHETRAIYWKPKLIELC